MIATSLVRARVYDGDSAWLHIYQRLRQGSISSPLLFNVFGAALIDVFVHRLAADPAIVSDLSFSCDTPKGNDGEPWKRGGWGKYGAQCGQGFMPMTPAQSRGSQAALLEQWPR